MAPDALPEAYHYVFAPLVNAHVPDDVLDCGSFRVQSIRGEALRNIAYLMVKHSIDARDTSPNDLELADEAAFVVKPLQVEVTTKPDPNFPEGIQIIESTPSGYDAFSKERETRTGFRRDTLR